MNTETFETFETFALNFSFSPIGHVEATLPGLTRAKPKQEKQEEANNVSAGPNTLPIPPLVQHPSTAPAITTIRGEGVPGDIAAGLRQLWNTLHGNAPVPTSTGETSSDHLHLAGKRSGDDHGERLRIHVLVGGKHALLVDGDPLLGARAFVEAVGEVPSGATVLMERTGLTPGNPDALGGVRIP